MGAEPVTEAAVDAALKAAPDQHVGPGHWAPVMSRADMRRTLAAAAPHLAAERRCVQCSEAADETDSTVWHEGCLDVERTAVADLQCEEHGKRIAELETIGADLAAVLEGYGCPSPGHDWDAYCPRCQVFARWRGIRDSDAGCGPVVSDRVKAEMDAAAALVLAKSEQVTALESQLQHAKAALAGDHEGIRLWMLDCAQVSQRRGERIAALESVLREALTYEHHLPAEGIADRWRKVLDGTP